MPAQAASGWIDADPPPFAPAAVQYEAPSAPPTITEIPLTLAAGVAAAIEEGVTPQPDPEGVVEVVPDVLTAEPSETVQAPTDDVPVELSVIDEESRAAGPVVEKDEVFQTVAVTWPQGTGLVPELQARVRTVDGAWSEWFPLEDDGAAPDQGTAEADGQTRGGTGVVFVGDSDAVQVATIGRADQALDADDVHLTLVGSEAPAETGMSEDVAAADGSTIDDSGARLVSNAVSMPRAPNAAVQSAAPMASQPTMVTRAQWGARTPTCTMTSAPKLVGGVVHHTATANTYTNQAGAMQAIRNAQAYHMDSRGWCDLGYSFIVDRFGTLYEGRAGSMSGNVIGVHAGGFNTGTVGVSVLGTFSTTAIPQAAVDTVGRILGWRLGVNGANPTGTISYQTQGGENSRYAAGTTVSLPTIFGHRDVAFTECPGNVGYTQMGAIRQAAAANAGAAEQGFVINGRGFGHGRGMGQWGALGYAVNHGWSERQILSHFYGGTTLATNAGNPEIGVELMAHSGREVRVSALSIRLNNQSLGNTTVRLVRNGTSLDWYTGPNCLGPWTRRGNIPGIATLTYDPAVVHNVDQMLRVCSPSFADQSGTIYRGRLDVLTRNNTQYTINTLSLQDYLRGVLPREMPASWGSQGNGAGANALRAGAVAARSFVLSGVGSPRPSTGVTCDTTACQVYGGAASVNATGIGVTGLDHTLTDAAIAATNGWVMRRANGTIARTEYAASTGGYTAGGEFPAVTDAGDGITSNPNRTWSQSFSRSQVASALGVGQITSMTVTRRNGLGADGGRVLEVAVVSGSSTRTFTGAQMRTALGLKSDWFTITTTGGSSPYSPAETQARAFVRSMFFDLLGRDADSSGLATFSHQLMTGRSVVDVMGEIIRSDEYVTRRVQQAYRDVLGRNPDAAYRGWVDAVHRGQFTVDDIAFLLYRTDEFYKLGGGNDASYVRHMFRVMLGRTAGADEVAFWVRDIAQNGRAHATHGVWFSMEAAQRRAAVYFRTFLGREPDLAGVAHWGQVMIAGGQSQGEGVVRQGFVGSAEYRTRSLARFPNG